MVLLKMGTMTRRLALLTCCATIRAFRTSRTLCRRRRLLLLRQHECRLMSNRFPNRFYKGHSMMTGRVLAPTSVHLHTTSP